MGSTTIVRLRFSYVWKKETKEWQFISQKAKRRGNVKEIRLHIIQVNCDTWEIILSLTKSPKN